jgi:hypothetical protein
MTHGEKVDHYLAMMARRKVHPQTAAPPLFRALWGLGLRVPPPHFIGFLPLMLASGILFGVGWGVAMRFLFWRGMGWPLMLGAAAGAGLSFGAAMAGYYRYSARKLGLPPWHRYPDA